MPSQIGSVNSALSAAARVAYQASASLVVVNSADLAAAVEQVDDLRRSDVGSLLKDLRKPQNLLKVFPSAEPFATLQLASIIVPGSLLLEGLAYLPRLLALPVVIHVWFDKKSDIHDLYLLKDLGFPILYSYDAQDAQDLATVAHSYSLSTNKAIVHAISEYGSAPVSFEDHRLLLELISSVELQTFAKPVELYASVESNEEPTESSETTSDPETSVDVSTAEKQETFLKQLFTLVKSITGRAYEVYDLSGDKSSEWAILAPGYYSNVFSEALSGSSFLLIRPRILSPVRSESLAQAIPSTVKRIAVLEQASELRRRWGPVLISILSAFNSDKFPSFELVDYLLLGVQPNTVDQALKKIFANLTSEHPVQGTTIGELNAAEEPQNQYAQPNLEQVYTKVLQQAAGSHLNIVNSHSDTAYGASRPEFGLGKYLKHSQTRQSVITDLQNLLSKVGALSAIGKDVSSWLTSDKDASISLDEHAKITDQLIDSLSAGAAGADSILAKKEYLYRKAFWIISSDIWAYDFGTSGVHHALSSGADINILVVESAPYSKRHEVNVPKKDIALYALNYGNAYTASVAVYSSYTQTLQAIHEAQQYRGPSIVVAYLPYTEPTDSAISVVRETKCAVDSGYWPLFRWDPIADDQNKDDAFKLDSGKLRRELQEFLDRSNRLTELSKRLPDINPVVSHSYGGEIRTRQQREAKDSVLKLLEGLIGPPVTILFASDGGTAESVAKRLGRRSKARGLTPIVLAMDEYPIEDLPQEQNVIFITSTAGQGEIPQNGRAFWESFKGSTDLDLSLVNFAVFGMGDSHYWPRKEDEIYYNKPSKDINAKLVLYGGKELVPLGLGDDQDPDGYETAYREWEQALWPKLGASTDAVIDEPPPLTNEDIKLASNYLRGTILEGLADETTGAISASDQQLTKFHGTYLQDDRDLREERKAQGLEPAYAFMIRVRLPGCVATPEQWLQMHKLADETGNHTMKITTRGTFQLHGVLKRNMKRTMKGINAVLLDTIAACGDVNRNVTLSALPTHSKLQSELLAMCKDLSQHLLPRTKAYHEIWLTDENDTKIKASGNVDVDLNEDEEPFYGKTYLPRKFKISVCVPPYNDTDVYAHDIGLIAIVEDGKLVGYNVLAGGGMGTTHSNTKTYPRTGSMMGYIVKEDVKIACEKICEIQRDNGDRKNRKHARLKYTIDDLGVDKFKSMVEESWGKKFLEPKPFKLESNIDHFGWVKDELGFNHFTMFIENGRVEDTPDFQMKAGLKVLAEALCNGRGEFRLTANQHLVISNISDEDLPGVKKILADYKLDNIKHTGLRLGSAACVGFPTCGLAMAESERYLPEFLSKLENSLEEYGLRHDSVTLRMTGCPNGCARPFLSEVALVGKAPGTYNLLLGGGYYGERLNKIFRYSVNEEQILDILKPLFKRWALERNDGEHFGDFLIRSGVIAPTVSGKQFYENIPIEA
ncbi:hypothetical protein CANCADRAFT_56491 [Tortispora caseinolytica NRRL Y-17796]|uniref:assimilatory sulfite reductase (NADPH) n=1 Tax=Tortispora caseinolytica NRRL Y-17796 TaxID=767744 RepID=A0A1E4TMH3_9ASCO|nr:hypothetical protein CANCADRAFT_56491 [Tortispora caseinolytica NRRL Y-17796]